MKLISGKFWMKVMSMGLVETIMKLRKCVIIQWSGMRDLRDVFEHTQEEQQELLDYYGKYVDDSMSNMEKAKEIAIAVNRRLSYDSDLNTSGKTEHWARPIETHNTMVDDCDGYACLIVYVLRLLGLEYWEVFVRGGEVHWAGKKSGHASVFIFDPYSFYFYVLEGSFLASKAFSQFGKVPVEQMSRYGKNWWMLNDKKSYSRIPYLRFAR